MSGFAESVCLRNKLDGSALVNQFELNARFKAEMQRPIMYVMLFY